MSFFARFFSNGGDAPPPRVQGGLGKAMVFRVTGIPLTATMEDLEDALLSAFSGSDSTLDTDQTTLLLSCYGRTQTALIQFTQNPPQILSDLSVGRTHQIRIKNSRSVISIDKDFYGLTQLYETSGEVKADIVAVPRLNGHAYESWRGRGNLQQMWLRDFFSEDFPDCRTMIYGYNSNLQSNSFHTALDWVTVPFLEELAKARQSEQEQVRPIVFIGHSFGGVIVARAIVRANECPDVYGPLFQSTRATVFFGTPHRGLVIDDILAMVGPDSPREHLILSITTGSVFLHSELSRFIDLSPNFRIVSFEEKGQTRKLQQGPDGRWSRSGPLFTAVERMSSVLQLPRQIEQVLPVEGDYSTMVKFEHKGDSSYTSVVRHLRNVMSNTPGLGARMGAINEGSETGTGDFQGGSESRTTAEEDNTALLAAAPSGRIETIKLLLDRGVEKNVKDENNNTALLLAAANGHTEMVNSWAVGST